MYKMQKQKYREKIQTKTGNLISQRKLEERNTAMQFRPADFHGITNIQRKKNETGLPDDLKSGLESASGFTMDDVRVHYNSEKPAKMQAYAYTQGTNIHVAPGQERYLPHEAWHVVQQKQGRVQPTMSLSGIAVNDNPGLEQEADTMGNLVLQGKFKQLGKTMKPVNSEVVQRALVMDSSLHNVEEQKIQVRTTGKKQTLKYSWVKADHAGWGNGQAECVQNAIEMSHSVKQNPDTLNLIKGAIGVGEDNLLWIYGQENKQEENGMGSISVTSYVIKHKHNVSNGTLEDGSYITHFDEKDRHVDRKVGKGQETEKVIGTTNGEHYHCAGETYMKNFAGRKEKGIVYNDGKIETTYYIGGRNKAIKNLASFLAEGASGSTKHHIFDMNVYQPKNR